jgi:hypothetical protein
LNGIETDTSPAPDFSEYDKLYANNIVKEIPDDMRLDKPYTGFANVDGKMFTLGFNSIAQCSYTSGKINITKWQTDLPGYFTQIHDLRYKNGLVYIITNYGFIYLDHYNISEQSLISYQSGNIMDVVSLKEPANSFVIISGIFIAGISANTANYGNSTHSLGATSLINVNETILAMGNQLTLYHFYVQYNGWNIVQVKQYPNISGTIMMKDGDTLIVAGKQGLLFYDISNLENIKPMP